MTPNVKETAPVWKYEATKSGVLLYDESKIILIGFSGDEYLFVPGVGFVDKIRETRH